jgi:hypothetical protein
MNGKNWISIKKEEILHLNQDKNNPDLQHCLKGKKVCILDPENIRIVPVPV